MVTTDGHIKLIDFGIAKQMNSLTTSDKQLTVAGKFLGKPEYAAPELVLGDVQHQNQTTDIYAVGILLYQLIVGHTPFEGARHEILEKQLKSKLPLSVIKNKSLRKIVQKACEKKQKLRFQTSAQMRVALETVTFSKKATTSISNGMRKMMIASLAAVFLLGIVLTMMLLSEHRPYNSGEKEMFMSQSETDDKDEVGMITEMLQNHNLAEDGLLRLKQYIEERQDLNRLTAEERSRYAEAVYLMSRLYFRSKASHDYIPDSILSMQQNLSIAVDDHRAHQLLFTVLEADSTEYHALYELGCDYLGGHLRLDGVNRNKDSADWYFRRALDNATVQKDNHYITLIKGQMEKYAE